MPAILRPAALVALAALHPLAAWTQAAPPPLRCEVQQATSFAATAGTWKERTGQAGGQSGIQAFSLVPILAPDICDVRGCSTYVNGWVMVNEPPSEGAYNCWAGSTPDAVICDLMSTGQALVNLSNQTALILSYEGFTFGLPDSRVEVSLAICEPLG